MDTLISLDIFGGHTLETKEKKKIYGKEVKYVRRHASPSASVDQEQIALNQNTKDRQGAGLE